MRCMYGETLGTDPLDDCIDIFASASERSDLPDKESPTPSSAPSLVPLPIDMYAIVRNHTSPLLLLLY